jgi:hypothetical protein
MKATLGATPAQIVYSSHRGSRDIEDIGSAHDNFRLEMLKAAAWQRMAAGQGGLEPRPELRSSGVRERVAGSASLRATMIASIVCGRSSRRTPHDGQRQP